MNDITSGDADPQTRAGPLIEPGAAVCFPVPVMSELRDFDFQARDLTSQLLRMDVFISMHVR